MASTNPLRTSGGKSICVVSPVTIILESWPSRVKNMSICDAVVFCASSRMITLSLRVRPRIKARGIDFDDIVDHESFDLLELDHIVQRVEKGPQIRVYLRLHVAGKESKAFTGLNRGAGQNDPLGLGMFEQAGGGGDGEIGLARPRRADAKSQIVVQDRLDVVPLPRGFRLDGPALCVNVDLVGGMLAAVIGRSPNGVADIFDAQPILPAKAALQLVEHGRGLADLFTLAESGGFRRPGR